MAAEDYIPFPIDLDEEEERAREAMGEDGYYFYNKPNKTNKEQDTEYYNDKEVWF